MKSPSEHNYSIDRIVRLIDKAEDIDGTWFSADNNALVHKVREYALSLKVPEGEIK